MKKNILFIADKPDWAYEFMIKAWLPYLQPEYNCYIAFQQDYAIKPNSSLFGFKKALYNTLNKIRLGIRNAEKVYLAAENNHYLYPVYQQPIVYLYNDHLEKKQVHQVNFDVIVEMAFYFQYTARFPFKAPKNLVGIFTDKFPHDGPNIDVKENTDRNRLSRNDFFRKYLRHYDHIIVGGGNLLSDYRKLTDKVDFVYGIYGQDHFLENKSVGEKPYLTVGWTGTPDRPMKGFRTIIEPAIENVKKTGRDIRLKTKFSGPYEELYSFYTDVDCVVIASDADSGPSMYAEASLSGVPVISTRVGLPLSFIKDKINGIYIDRSIESLENTLIDLYDHREKLQSFAQRTKADYMKVMDNSITVEYIKKIIS